MLKKLRFKFICINMLIVTVMLGVIFCLVLHFTQKSLEEESLRMMRMVASNPLQTGRPGDMQNEVRLPYFTVQINRRGEHVLNGNGYFDLSDDAFLEELLAESLEGQEQSGTLPKYGLRYLRQNTPAGISLVFADLSSEKTTMKNLMTTCLIIGAVSFLAFLGISFLLSNWAVRPVEQAWNQQRQFVADASHELKTPLTVILTNAELLQDPDYGEEARKTSAGSILTMSNQMRGLVESLLELARVDNWAEKTAFTQVNVSKLIFDAVLPFEPLFFEKELELKCRIEPSVFVRGSQSHLRQVAEILLDNALKYTTGGSEVWVTLKKHGSHCLFTVSNPGEPISQADLKNIFKRFYRMDRVRSMNHSYGLGLPIAESIVREHGGKIWAESNDHLILFHVQLPISYNA